MGIKSKLFTAVHSIGNHLERNKKLYLGIGYSLVVTILIDPSEAFASVDESGRRFHMKVVSIGKWVIIIKGSIDAIQSVLNGDMQAAKKTFLSYLMCFAIMLGLPWCLDEIEGVFKDV